MSSPFRLEQNGLRMRTCGNCGQARAVWVGHSCPTLLTLILALPSKGIGVPRPCHVNPTSKTSDKSAQPTRAIRYADGSNGASLEKHRSYAVFVLATKSALAAQRRVLHPTAAQIRMVASHSRTVGR